MRNRYKKENKKYLCDWHTTEIVGIEEKNKQYKDKYKCVFYCKSSTDIPRMCIAWGEHDIAVGDTVQLKGRFENNIFLCRKIYVQNRTIPQESVSDNNAGEV